MLISHLVSKVPGCLGVWSLHLGLTIVEFGMSYPCFFSAVIYDDVRFPDSCLIRFLSASISFRDLGAEK
jgi:hypothetical protein